MTSKDQEKFEKLNQLLDQEHVLVHVNLKAQGFVLPDHLLNNPSVTLKLSRWFRGSLDVQPDKVLAELLFNNTYFACTIPYHSVWGMTSASGEIIIWPDSVPPEVLANLILKEKADREEGGKQQKTPIQKGQKGKGHLRRVK